MKKIFIMSLVVSIISTQLFAQKIKILTNQLGYNTEGPKKAVVLGFENSEVNSYKIINSNSDQTVKWGEVIKSGKVDNWKDWYFWTIDFSSLQADGKYYIECETNSGLIRSFPFLIQKDILERHTLSDVIFYFRGQRCIGQFDKADRYMTFLNGRKDTVDVHGGWHDASGDYGKHLSHLSFSTYFNPQQLPLVVYSLAKTYDMLNKRTDDNYNQFKRRLIDETLYGADYLVRIHKPGGSFYRTVAGRVPGKKPEDRRITPTMSSFSIKTKKPVESEFNNQSVEQKVDTVYEVGYRAGAGIAIASLALASKLNIDGDYSSKDYLRIAEEAFAYLEKNNLYLTNNGKENIVDDYCALAASTELFRATGNPAYKLVADRRADNLINRTTSWESYNNYMNADGGTRPFFHAADAGFPVVTLLYYLDISSESSKRKVLEIIRKNLQHELDITSEVLNPFGYARQLVQHKDGSRNSSFFFPHDTETEPWWQGENARLASLAFAARLAAQHFQSDTSFFNHLEDYACNQINWILGLNPYDSCMLHGTGRNNIEYMFFGSYQYTNAPGGICNGITSGLNDEHDIDFNLLYSETGKDYDWRWGEQWLPHASWYLMAIAAQNLY